MKVKIYCLLFFVVFSCVTTSAQKANKKITITGIVMDMNGKPVSGAIIFIDGKQTNITTDEKGFYKIKVNPKAKTLSVFTLMNGLNEAQLTGQSTINFTMTAAGPSQKTETQSKSKDETVNVGYGTMKKKDMTTQVGKIDGTNPKYASYRNIYEMIRGELPGVQVMGKSIIIQGPTSVNLPNDPLLVVDGVIVPSIDDISPLQVKSIEVLKGSSAAIYGSRGANGVVMITLIGSPDIKK
jgi:TonB-dependent starch-binding outer membrane protein SusC